ncbi:MAG: hypothetical protein LBC62_09360 [Treponema sp.]|jgi:hypothetical protein|nr:hypothetical protein [Treponema sp.]
MIEHAKPVFIDLSQNANSNRFAAFRADIDLAAETDVQIKIAARSFYRLYINGGLAAHGPARTGHGMLRVDEIQKR